MLHKEILTEEQLQLLPLLKSFSSSFGLVGGTAIALYIDHRQSVDFDLFTKKEFDNFRIRQEIAKFTKIEKIITDQKDQYTMIVKGVRMTFFLYPYPINFSKNFETTIKIPDLLTLAAMKAHALGRRAKWKDYVDLYFIMRDYFKITEIIKKARQIFSTEFNEKLFRTQLSYFKDIDHTEKVIYMKGSEQKDKTIKQFLTQKSLEF